MVPTLPYNMFPHQQKIISCSLSQETHYQLWPVTETCRATASGGLALHSCPGSDPIGAWLAIPTIPH